MTRKHFIAIADSIGLEIRHSKTSVEKDAIRRTAQVLCLTFWETNPNFDRVRFMDWIDEVAAGTRAVIS